MNRATTLLGGFFVIAIAVVFVVNFQPGGGRNQLQDSPECAADVLGNCVRREHYSASYRIIVPSGIDSQTVKQYRLKQLVMDGLIERELLLAEAKRLGIGVSDDEITQELKAGRIHASVPSNVAPLTVYQLGLGDDGVRNFKQLFLDPKTQKFSAEQYKRTVTELTHMSDVDFREFQRVELIAHRMRQIIKSRVHVSDAEARDQFVREKSSATVKYAFVTPAFIADKVLDRSDAAVAAWAEKNAETVDKAFETRKKTIGDECRVAHHILLRLQPTATDDEKKKAKEKLEGVKKEIEGGASFEDFAKKLSKDIETSKEGGSLGCLSKGDWPQAFDDALWKMEKEGSLSEIVETPFGVHLIRLDKVLKGDDAMKAARLRTARKIYVLSEAKRIAGDVAKEIQTAAKGGKPLEDAIKEYLAKITPPAPAPEEKKDEKKGEKKGDDKAAPPKDDAKKDDAKKDEEKKDEPVEDEEEGGEDYAAAPTVETSLPFTASGAPFQGTAQGEDPTTIALGLAKPGDVADKLVTLQNGGFAIMQLVERKGPGDAEWTEGREFYVQSLRAKKQQGALAEYMKRLRAAHTADIKPNDHFTTDPEDKAKASPSSEPPEG